MSGRCGMIVPTKHPSPLKERNENKNPVTKRKLSACNTDDLRKSMKKPRTLSVSEGKENDAWNLHTSEDSFLLDSELSLLQAVIHAEDEYVKKQQCHSSADESKKVFESDDLELDSSFFDTMMLDEEEDFKIQRNDILDLSGSALCEVLQVWRIPDQPVNKFIQLKSCENCTTTAVCCLRPPWSNVPVKEGDIVSVIGAKCDNDTWYVDMDTGLLTHHSDFLVSSTSVVGSLFCRRRSVLAEWFRGVDVAASSAVIGSLVHSILQEVLKRKLFDQKSVESVAVEMLNNHNTVIQLLSCGLGGKEAHSEIMAFVPRIMQFLHQHVLPSTWKNGKLLITNVEDVEENIWSPRLGVKGKIDVTVKVQSSVRSSQMMPLELKTGRPSFSPEHKGQVILYILMMRDLGYSVDTGLLLYFRDEVSLTEVPQTRRESRDLIQLRNELASNVRSAMPQSVGEPPVLPEPINRQQACSRCPYLVECSVYQRASNPKHPFLELGGAAHLSQESVSYFLRWTGLLGLEEAHRLSNSKLADLWKLSAAEREKRGRCASNLCLEGKTVCCGNAYRQRLVVDCKDRDLSAIGGLSEGDYVLISSELRIAITTGTIEKIDSSGIDILLNRDLTARNYGKKFHVDIYESQASISYLMTSLGLLMENSEPAAKLRNIVIDRVPPTFTSKKMGFTNSLEKAIFEKLNTAQRNAVSKALSSEDYLLICGMPGTGKTETLVSLVRLLVGRGESVLVTSNTHSAVDNLLRRLIPYNLPLLRLGSEQRVHPDLHSYGESQLARGCKTPEELTKKLDSKMVVGTTCLGTSNPLLIGRRFSVCLVDESTQALQVMVLRPLLLCKRFILVGDPQQLPPVVASAKARKLGLDESLFARLDGLGATVVLDLQYRMNQSIVRIANLVAYKGRLRCANEDVAKSVLKTGNEQAVPRWMVRLVSSELRDAVLFVDTGLVPKLEGKDTENGKYTNKQEVALVRAITNALKNVGVLPEHVGIIAPFRAQVSLLKKTFPLYEVNTVDQFQGRDKPVIIFSCTRSKESKDAEAQVKAKEVKEEEADEIKHEVHLLDDVRRLTVAVTRAKHKLIMIGDATSLRQFAPFRCILEYVERKELMVTVREGECEFSWRPLLKSVCSG